MQITKAIRALANEHLKGSKESDTETKAGSLENLDALEVMYFSCSDCFAPYLLDRSYMIHLSAASLFCSSLNKTIKLCSRRQG